MPVHPAASSLALVGFWATASYEPHRGGQSTREGANHTVYSLDGLLIPIPRHNEIAKGTTEAIYRECTPKLGKGWWR